MAGSVLGQKLGGLFPTLRLLERQRAFPGSGSAPFGGFLCHFDLLLCLFQLSFQFLYLL
jgi:hypothetical protein